MVPGSSLIQHPVDCMILSEMEIYIPFLHVFFGFTMVMRDGDRNRTKDQNAKGKRKPPEFSRGHGLPDASAAEVGENIKKCPADLFLDSSYFADHVV